jgi:hypothetical protein
MQEIEGSEAGPGRIPDEVSGLNPKPGLNRDRKFWVAMGAYGILAVLIWFTLGEGTVFAFGRQVEIRLIPLFVIGTFVLRTMVAREADKIRRRGEDQAS